MKFVTRGSIAWSDSDYTVLCRDIKQYHVEGDVPVGGVILLGTHNPARDSWEVSNKTYHPQWYGNGSRYVVITMDSSHHLLIPGVILMDSCARQR